ncbi:hypothetical protein GCM10022223_20070 [Kineosporia mesophila]|uniref:HD domain-containing protein n=1 Tax=Kineosporia mesophila TaxID=566012 RepID=A0ABP6ZED9_9ACTN|nr:dNTP triphosphohydrolase [Kineosporia mesophila]MCD5350106.1 dNTP triphosphohydrolase [Kineosporia mesophila]
MSRTQDKRSACEKDCDRIMYSDELRRLAGVTQVFAADEMPLFHNRLTHTLKVQQLARRIAESINANHLPRRPATRRIDVAGVEAAALAHDLGHPPFGHIAEHELDKICRKWGLDGFEGNAQTFRILVKIAQRKPSTPGLVTSPITLRGVVKYPWLRVGEHQGASKWNAYVTERDTFQQFCSSSGAQSLEASIMDWADDITYAVHDLEDFIRARKVPLTSLLISGSGVGEQPGSESLEWARFYEYALGRVQDKVHKIIAISGQSAPDWTNIGQDIRAQLRIAFSDFAMPNTTAPDIAHLRQACSNLINKYVECIEFISLKDPIHVPTSARIEVELLKQLTWRYIIHDPQLATIQEGQVVLVRELTNTLIRWVLATYDDVEGKMRWPANLRRLVTIAEEDSQAHWMPQRNRAVRAVVDYVSSLTEVQASSLAERLLGRGRQSAMAPWVSY